MICSCCRLGTSTSGPAPGAAGMTLHRSTGCGVQTVDRHGVLILKVEMGSFNDMTLDPTSISGSFAFFITTACQSGSQCCVRRSLLSFSTDCLVITLRCLIRWVSSSTVNFLAMYTNRLYFCRESV